MELKDEDILKMKVLFRQTLEFPSIDTTKKQFILCPVGLVGAGKTTIIKPLAKRLGLLRLSSDEFRKLLSDYGYNWDRASEVVISMAEEYATEGYSIAADGDCASKIEKTKEWTSKVGLDIIWIHINPPEEFILNKLRNFKHTWLFKDGNQAIENYFNRKPLHENLNLPFLYTFDTSKDNLDEQIEEAVKRIEKKVKK